MASRREHASLWIGQTVLSVIFMTASFIKTSTPTDQLALVLPWTIALPTPLVRFIGVVEGLGALGLVLPALLRIRPMLTPVAAGGLTLLMICAAIFHLVRGETSQIVGVAVLGVLTAGVAWGRVWDAPITARHDDEDSAFDLPESDSQ